MTDYQSIADDLRSLCQSADQVLTDAVRDAASAYRDACQEVNARLRRCEEFLQKGLRSEAIQLAEADPPLLDALAALDFPERLQWDQIAGMYGLPAAPRLRVQTAEALNRAYAEEQPLQLLLRDHRRLNLARAPLHDRLAVLRKLHQLDGGNSVWTEDIRAFETTRHRDLSDEVDQATAAGDIPTIGRCWEEVRNSHWFNEPPAGLTNRLRGVFVRQVAEELHEALCGQHFARGQRLREQWETLAPEGSLPAGDPLLKRAAPALRWLAVEEKRRAGQMALQIAIADLEQGIQTGVPLDRLQELWADVRDSGEAVPSGIEGRYLQRVEALRKKREGHEKLILVGAFLAGVVVLVGFLLFVILRTR